MTRLTRSGRATVVAMGVVVVVALVLLLSTKGKAQENAGNPAQQAETNAGATEQPSSVAKAPDAKHHQPSCTNPKDHDDADLCEQKRMSAAAENAVWWSRAQTALGAVGFLAVIATLALNVLATQASSRSAVVASEQLELSRHALISTNRAYVSVTKIHAMAGYSPIQKRVVDWTFFFVWENAGNTPTRKMRMGTSWRSSDQDLPEDFDFPDVVERGYEVPMVLGPKATTFSGECTIPIELIEHAQKETAFLYLWGWVEYDDVFDGTTRHRTENCVRVIVAGDPKIHQYGSDNQPMVPFQYRGHRFFCGSDEDCFRHPSIG